MMNGSTNLHSDVKIINNKAILCNGIR